MPNELYDKYAYRFTWELPVGLEAEFDHGQKAARSCGISVSTAG